MTPKTKMFDSSEVVENPYILILFFMSPFLTYISLQG